MRPNTISPVRLLKSPKSRVGALMLAVALHVTACDGGLPGPEPETPEELATRAAAEGSGGFGLAPDEEMATVVSAPAEPVAAMAHDVTTWTTRSEARAVIEVAPVGPHLLMAAMLRDGWRLELHTMPTSEKASRLVSTHVHPSFESGSPVLAVTPEPPGAGPVGLVAWVQDGVLFVQSISIAADGLAMGEARAAYMATETHEITGQPVIAESHPDAVEPWFVCARENIRGLVCASMNVHGEVDEWKAIGALRGHEPRGLHAVAEGYVGISAACRTEDDCSSENIVTLLLDRQGQPLRKRGTRLLALTQARRALVVIPTEHGLFVAGRRRTGQYVTAWHVVHGGVRELDGRFDRLQGGLKLSHGDVSETWLLEESPLVMRGGFPVGLLRPSRWSSEHGREEPLSWPTHVNESLPGQPGQKVLTQGGLVAILMPVKGGITETTFLHLKPNGGESAPVKARKGEQKQRKRRAKAQ